MAFGKALKQVLLSFVFHETTFAPPAHPLPLTYRKKNSSETLKFEALEPTKSISLYVSVLAM